MNGETEQILASCEVVSHWCQCQLRSWSRRSEQLIEEWTGNVGLAINEAADSKWMIWQPTGEQAANG